MNFVQKPLSGEGMVYGVSGQYEIYTHSETSYIQKERMSICYVYQEVRAPLDVHLQLNDYREIDYSELPVETGYN